MMSLDDRLRSASEEVSRRVREMPAPGVETIVSRVRHRRAMAGAGLAAVAVVSVVGMLVAVGDDPGSRPQSLAAGQRGSGTTVTTIIGDSTVSDPVNVPYLHVSEADWQILDARDTANADAPDGTAGAVPSHHARYVRRDGNSGIASLDIFGIPAGSFYETMVPLLAASEGFSTVEIGDVPARLKVEGQSVSLAWRYSDDVVVALTVLGAPDEATALSIAESIVEIDSARWRTLTSQTPRELDSATTTIPE